MLPAKVLQIPVKILVVEFPFSEVVEHRVANLIAKQKALLDVSEGMLVNLPQINSLSDRD